MRDFSTRRRPRPWRAREVLLAAGTALALGATVLAASRAWSERSHVATRVAELQASVESARRRVGGLEGRRRGAGSLASQAWLTAESPPPRVVRELADLLPGAVRLDGLVLAYGERLEIEMTVVARDARAYDAFLARLEASPVLEAVVPGPETREGGMRTTVRATYRGAPP
jgi:hypothetical protein